MKGGGADGGVAKPGMKKTLSVKANIMTPVKPMLVWECVCVCGGGGGCYEEPILHREYYMGALVCPPSIYSTSACMSIFTTA